MFLFTGASHFGAFGMREERWAAAGLSALLVVMLPANIHKALHDPILRTSQELGPRTALHVVFGRDAGRPLALPSGSWPRRDRRSGGAREGAV